jgi:2-oxoglutarate ferredoxin oxidoreductase subunit delta
MAKIRGSIVVNVEKCKGCEVCMVTCPTGTIAMAKEVNGKGYNYAFLLIPSCVLVVLIVLWFVLMEL